MPQHTENWVGIFFWKKILDQNINPIPEQLLVRDGQYRKMVIQCICSCEVSGSIPGIASMQHPR